MNDFNTLLLNKINKIKSNPLIINNFNQTLINSFNIKITNNDTFLLLTEGYKNQTTLFLSKRFYDLNDSDSLFVFAWHLISTSHKNEYIDFQITINNDYIKSLTFSYALNLFFHKKLIDLGFQCSDKIKVKASNYCIKDTVIDTYFSFIDIGLINIIGETNYYFLLFKNSINNQK